MIRENRQDFQGEKMIKLYSTHCPKCIMLENKLKQKKVKYEVETSEDKIRETGFSSVPLLEADGKIMEFTEAIAWVNKQK